MSQRHNTICQETRVNDSPLLARPKLVSGSAQKPAIGRAYGKLVEDAGCWTNGNTGRPCPPDAFFTWNWIDAWLPRLVGVNQLAAALKQAARWLLPSHSCCEIPLPISSTEALEFDPSRIRDNGQAKVYINELHDCLLLGIVVPRLFSNFFFNEDFFQVQN